MAAKVDGIVFSKEPVDVLAHTSGKFSEEELHELAEQIYADLQTWTTAGLPPWTDVEARWSRLLGRAA